MEAKMSLQSRRELLNRVRARYLAAGRKEKSRILDEFLQATGYHRKYAVSMLHTGPASTPNKKQRKRVSKYGEAVVSLHDKCDRFLHDKSDIQTVSLKLSAAKISIKGSEMHLKNIRHGMN